MRHRKSGRKFGMDSSARKAMIRNMVTSLFVHGQIKTTEARAKELRRYAERLISIGKRAPSSAQLEALSGTELERARADRVTAIRRLRSFVMNDEAVKMVMGEYADRYRERPGGYTRVLKLGRPRPGDNARMAMIALVDDAYEPKARATTPEPEAAAPNEAVSEEEEPTEVVGEDEADGGEEEAASEE